MTDENTLENENTIENENMEVNELPELPIEETAELETAAEETTEEVVEEAPLEEAPLEEAAELEAASEEEIPAFEAELETSEEETTELDLPAEEVQKLEAATLEESEETSENEETPTLEAASNEESSEENKEEDFELELDYLDDEKQEEKLWQARTGLDHDTLCGAIETIIFMNDKPVPLAKIRKIIDEDMPLRVLHDAVSRLQEEYEAKHHGIRLQEVAEGYQFRTKPTFAKYVQDLFKVNSLVLSPTALEVLAIIAYKQPCSKTEIDKIRGVDSSHIVRGLMDKRLVKICGRSDEVGKPTLYGTTQEFLEVFNLPDISALPPEHELEEIATANEVGQISDIKTICAGDKEKFKFDEIEELDQLSEEIKKITSDTEFTKSLKSQEKSRKTAAASAQSTAEGEAPAAPAPKAKAKTAFEILEEFVEKSILTDANKGASDSELFTAVTQPWIVNDLLQDGLNAPDGDDEDFEMIDLDTGLPIEEEAELAAEGEEGTDNEEQSAGELLLEQEREAQMLSDALDEAFSNLTGESLDEELDVNEEKLDELESDLEQSRQDLLEKGKELDIDLEFMNENSDTSEPEASENIDEER